MEEFATIVLSCCVLLQQIANAFQCTRKKKGGQAALVWNSTAQVCETSKPDSHHRILHELIKDMLRLLKIFFNMGKRGTPSFIQAFYLYA